MSTLKYYEGGEWKKVGRPDMTAFGDLAYKNTTTPADRTGGFRVGVMPASELGSAGNKVVTGLDFKPKIVRFTFMIDVATIGRSSTGAMDELGNQFAATQANNGTDNTSIASEAYCAMWYNSNGTALVVGVKFVSMNPDGFTVEVVGGNTAYALAWEAQG